jgi:AmpE protein
VTFLALLIGLVLNRAWVGHGRVVHRDGWYHRWRGQLRALGFSPAVLLGLEVLLPVLLVHLALDALRPLLFGLGWIAAASVILLYSLGRGSLGAESERYRSQCRRGDFVAAHYGVGVDQGVADVESPAPDSPTEVHRGAQSRLLYESLQRWFAVVLYFVLLGPAGALAYRLVHLSATDSAAARSLLFYADWLPARLAAAAFVVTGNFLESADELYDGLRQPRMGAASLLYSVAMAATGQDRVVAPEDDFGDFAARENEIFQALLRRSKVCWIGVISLLVLV